MSGSAPCLGGGGASPNLISEAEGAGGGGDRRCEVWLKISEVRCQSETSAWFKPCAVRHRVILNTVFISHLLAGSFSFIGMGIYSNSI